MDQQQHTTDKELQAIASDGLALLSSINKLSSSVISTQHAEMSNQELFLLGSQLRFLRLSQAVEALISKELTDPAAVILRVMLEMGFVMSAIGDDISHLERLILEQEVESRKALEGLRKHIKEDERQSDIADERLDAEIAAAPTGSAFKPHNWAGRAKHMPAYATLYRQLSTFAHGSAGGTLEYFEKDANDALVLRPNVSKSIAPNVLTVAGSLMLDALQAFPLSTMTPTHMEEIKELENQMKSLSVRVGHLG